MRGGVTEARGQAAKCTVIAESATSPTIQKTFFDLARQWHRLARDLDDAYKLRDALNKLDGKSGSLDLVA